MWIIRSLGPGVGWGTSLSSRLWKGLSVSVIVYTEWEWIGTREGIRIVHLPRLPLDLLDGDCSRHCVRATVNFIWMGDVNCCF
jgi:hypothetical protein